MKIILIFLFTSIGMGLVNFGMDLLSGDQKDVALTNMMNPFWVMKPFEYLLLMVLFLCTLAGPIIIYIKEKHSKT